MDELWCPYCNHTERWDCYWEAAREGEWEDITCSACGKTYRACWEPAIKIDTEPYENELKQVSTKATPK